MGRDGGAIHQDAQWEIIASDLRAHAQFFADCEDESLAQFLLKDLNAIENRVPIPGSESFEVDAQLIIFFENQVRNE